MAGIVLRAPALLPRILPSILISACVLFSDRSIARDLGAAECAALADPSRVSFSGFKITAATLLPPGPFKAPAQPASRTPEITVQVSETCRVEGVAQPAADSSIGFEVWLPVKNWNGKLFMNGNGGFSSELRYGATRGGPGMATSNPGLADGASRGYVSVVTDTGHKGHDGDLSFASVPDKAKDFGWRAVHESVVAAKAIANSFYGNGPRYSYFTGCSTGGRQGIREAQQFPGDFDGIVALNPVHNMVNLLTQLVWVHQAAAKEPASYIPLPKYKMIQDAAVAACDATDGVRDGLIGNPAKCTFDPAVLQCRGNVDGPACLTSAQVTTVNKIYSPARNPRTGAQIFPGMARGSEAGWPELTGATATGQVDPFPLPKSFYQIMLNEPKWNPMMLDFDADLQRALAADAKIGQMANSSADLSAFKARGGKLIQVAAWSDHLVSPFESINYFNRVVEAQGSVAEAEKFHRLFMLPGAAHCSNTLAGGKGYGPDYFDGLEAISQWVEAGKAPGEHIIVSQIDEAGKAHRTRPLCPYPKIASYKGEGSLDDAANFVCR